MRLVTLFIATSRDGFIADENRSVQFLEAVVVENEDYGYAQFLESIDLVVLGRKTYDSVIQMGFDYPHANREVYVFSRTPRNRVDNVVFYAGDPIQKVTELKQQGGRGIYCDGGAEIAQLLLQSGVIDEVILSIVPVDLNGGVELLRGGSIPTNWNMVEETPFSSGLIQRRYTLN
jgi:dihydrofolate reductase